MSDYFVTHSQGIFQILVVIYGLVILRVLGGLISHPKHYKLKGRK